MLSPEENDLLTRVGPGTPMGELMRQYWIPALMSSELPAPEGPPLRLRLLGENLIAFRTISGKVGLLAHACPHRGASLFFGRNEAEGLRCVYHGWKFDVAGRCVDMPTEPADSTYAQKVRARAYPCTERNGIIWTYMGPREVPPPLPDLEPNLLPSEQTRVWTALRECNWLQALDGDLDAAHLGLLHLGSVSPEQVTPGSFDYYTVTDRAPGHKVIDTEYGTMSGTYRLAAADTYYWRIYQFLFPFYALIPPGALGQQALVRAWVPIDDTHTMFWNMSVPPTRLPVEEGRVRINAQPLPGTTGLVEFLPNTTDWLGRWRLKGDASNDYFVDREVQRTVSFTGIGGVHLQDKAVTESMGPIVDRAHEHLGTTDEMIIRTRRRLMRAALDVQAGIAPPAVDNPELYRQRSAGVILPGSADWVEATEKVRQAFASHPEAVPPASRERKRPATLEEFAAADEHMRMVVHTAGRRAFQTRPTDIFIATFPKCGTTWMQQIVHGLRTGGSMDFDDISLVVPFFEMAPLLGSDPDMPQVAEPRAFKTHLRRDVAPKGGRYICVLRDPGDALVSWYHYVNGVLVERDAIAIDDFARGVFLSAPGGPWGRYWDHLRSWWPLHEREEALFVCFEQMKQDLADVVARVARFMGLDADGAFLELVARQASFEYMHQHGRQFDGKPTLRALDTLHERPSGETWVKLRSGRVGDHRHALSAETQEALSATWQREIEATLGFASYDELRAHLASRARR